MMWVAVMRVGASREVIGGRLVVRVLVPVGLLIIIPRLELIQVRIVEAHSPGGGVASVAARWWHLQI